MKQSTLRIGGIAVLAGLALAAVGLPAARSQILAGPSFLPIGVSASGNLSTVWFHEPSSGRAMACQTVSSAAGGLSGIQCVTTKLP